MGLIREGINEVIATTYFNAAPIGIISRGGSLKAALFLGSHTAENVERDGWIVANFVFEPVLYVKTAFGDLPESEFLEETVDGRVVHRLKGAEAWAAFRAEAVHRGEHALTVTLTLLREEVIDPVLHPVNRGFNSIIDATVHATRYRMNGDPALRALIDHHAAIVKKCGGPREREALELLEKFLE